MQAATTEGRIDRVHGVEKMAITGRLRSLCGLRDGLASLLVVDRPFDPEAPDACRTCVQRWKARYG